LVADSLYVRSFAKINLALAILRRRADGYHEIRTVLQTIDLHDHLELRRSTEVQLECTGLESVTERENLVWRAASAWRDVDRLGRGAHIILRKRIPVGAGLGGGSSNAAATLLGLCKLWDVDPATMDLHGIAVSLGSDVPFFLQGGPALGIGRGEEIYPLPEPNLPAHLLVIYPGVPIATAEAYRNLNLALTSGEALPKMLCFCGGLSGDSNSLPEIFNDFETSILPAYPSVREALSFLREHGATAALLSGSGSAVFGFFCDEESALAACRCISTAAWRVFPAKTLSRAEYHQRIFG
jgi:4-diphosphocytidyl-2-C-methyl-D-erythritol kinase